MPRLLFIAYGLTLFVRLTLTWLNLSHRRKNQDDIPALFAASVDAETFRKSQAYNTERETFGLFRQLLEIPFVLWFYLGGGLVLVDRAAQALQLSPLLFGVGFFVALAFAGSLLELPLDLYSTFRIEQRHGFNRMTLGLYAADWVKSTLVSSVLLAFVSASGLLLHSASPVYYYLWFWGFVMVFGLTLMVASPYVIEPLFMKTEPVTSEELTQGVRQLSSSAGVRVTQVLQMDASRRTGHSNAYFTGIGRTKRVVLFDTLLEKLTPDETLGVLAHELGHWKLRHVTQRLIGMSVMALAVLYGASRLLGSELLTELMGQPGGSLPAQVTFLGWLLSLGSFWLTPWSAYLSRRHEWQADNFASNLTREPKALAQALVKLARDNLSNLHPHPWFATFYHSHPTTSERVQKLLGTSS